MRIVKVTMVVLVLISGLAVPALADHTHVRATGNGGCVVLAPEGGEKYVSLPHQDAFPENRRHPLHVKVHLGEPGERAGQAVVWVAGSPGDLANCGGYVNR